MWQHKKTFLHGVHPGTEVIKLEYSLKLKINRNNWLLADMCRMQPIIVLYFECEMTQVFFYLQAWSY